jgi:hypothetical protein
VISISNPVTDILIPLGIIFFSFILLIVLTLPRFNRGPRSLRPIQGFQRLRRAIGLAVEDGKRLHVSLGKSSLLDPTNPSALMGLNTLERITQLSMMSDRPPIATSGDGALSILSQDTLRAVYRTGNILEQYDPDRGRMAGITPLSYIVGTLPVARQENVSAHILIGNFGPEVGLLTDAAAQQNAYTLAASDSLPAQAVLYATADETLIGEELYAASAYLNAGPAHTASLRVQDILRWGIIIMIVVGILLKLVGISLL